MADDLISDRSLAIDPPRAAAERHTLVTFLDYFRSVLARKAAGLTADQLDQRVAPSSLTIGGLVRHMAFVEDHWFQFVWLGRDYPEPWAVAPWDAQPDWEFDTAPKCSPTELIEQFDMSVERSRISLGADADLDAVAARQSRNLDTNLRWILVHMIEEYARHCGHADLIREAIDGQTGD